MADYGFKVDEFINGLLLTYLGDGYTIMRSVHACWFSSVRVIRTGEFSVVTVNPICTVGVSIWTKNLTFGHTSS